MKSNKGFTFYSRAYSLHTKRGFTLIELLVVIAIIGVLATIVIGSINTAQAKARDARREQDIKSIQTALQVYYMDHGKYPTGDRYSYASSWETLETILGVNLPVDPINENITPQSGGYSYRYYAVNSSAFCNAQAYFISYRKEDSNFTVGHVKMCNGSSYGAAGGITVGVDVDGKMS